MRAMRKSVATVGWVPVAACQQQISVNNAIPNREREGLCVRGCVRVRHMLGDSECICETDALGTGTGTSEEMALAPIGNEKNVVVVVVCNTLLVTRITHPYGTSRTPDSPSP